MAVFYKRRKRRRKVKIERRNEVIVKVCVSKNNVHFCATESDTEDPLGWMSIRSIGLSSVGRRRIHRILVRQLLFRLRYILTVSDVSHLKVHFLSGYSRQEVKIIKFLQLNRFVIEGASWSVKTTHSTSLFFKKKSHKKQRNVKHF